MSTVILAEKPNQAKAYAEAFQHNTRRNGYFEVSDSILSEKTFITYGIGHLVHLAEPGYYDDKWKTWNKDALPIFPRKYEFLVSEDKEKQFKVVSNLLKRASTIVIATDCDREGENIAWSIIHQANASSKVKTFKRLWINSLETDVIREGFKNLKPASEFYPYYVEAQTRQISDWLVGMNATQIYTECMKSKGVRGTFSVGRVQTPTLYLIYKRQLQIENFKKEKYYEIEGEIEAKKGTFKGTLRPSEQFKELAEVNAYVLSKQAKLGKQQGIITKIETDNKKTASPKLYSLSALQSKINSMYKATATQTLQAVQGLYEAKFLTYPRTDTDVITTNEFEYLQTNIGQYQGFLNSKEEIVHESARTRYVNNQQVKEHYAIIPTKRVPSKDQFDKLDTLQQNIYMLILQTTVAMFLDDYHYQETVVETQVENLKFTTTGKTPLKQGWKAIFSKSIENEDTEEKGQSIPIVKVGEKVVVDLKSVQKETVAPKAYTEGTLLSAMKNVNKEIEDQESSDILKEVEGIGTEATRAAVIEALKRRKYVILQKNKLIVTEQGKLLCQAIEGQKLLKSAEMTAKWENQLKKIGKKEADQQSFVNNIKKFIVHLIEHVPSDIDKLDFKAFEAEKSKEYEKSVVGKCPKCGKDIVAKKGFYSCSNYPGCKFTLPDNFRKKKLSKINIQFLLQGNETIVSSIKSKDKKSYSAVIKLGKSGLIEFVSFASTAKK